MALFYVWHQGFGMLHSLDVEVGNTSPTQPVFVRLGLNFMSRNNVMCETFNKQHKAQVWSLLFKLLDYLFL